MVACWTPLLNRLHSLLVHHQRHKPEPSSQTTAKMVELVEVEDESFETKQAGPSDNEDDYYTDTGTTWPFLDLSAASGSS